MKIVLVPGIYCEHSAQGGMVIASIVQGKFYQLNQTGAWYLVNILAHDNVKDVLIKAEQNFADVTTCTLEGDIRVLIAELLKKNIIQLVE